MKKILGEIARIFGLIIFCILVVILFWLYLVITPDQCSAECDAVREEMKRMGWID